MPQFVFPVIVMKNDSLSTGVNKDNPRFMNQRLFSVCKIYSAFLLSRGQAAKPRDST